MSHFLMFGFCVDCDRTRDLTTAAKCGTCGSDSIVVRKAHQCSPPSVIEELMQLESMFHLTEQVERTR
jgi:hypothetical protein